MDCRFEGNPRGLAQPSTSPAKAITQQNTALESDIVSTPKIQKWMTNIELHLNEVCSIAGDGKLNSEQKMKISTLFCKIGSGTSQMAVLYQSLKQKALQAYNVIETLEEKRDLTIHISQLKQTIQDPSAPGNVSFAEMVKKGANNFVRPNNLSSVAIYPNDNLKSSDETKNPVQKMIRPELMKLQVRGVSKTKNGRVIGNLTY